MKFLKLLIIIFISLTTSIKAEINKNLKDQLEDGGKLIFIRHAYAPGNGDPVNFNLNDCSTQRNLNEKGKIQAKEIGRFFKKNEILVDRVLSSSWCRCIETANLAFNDFIKKDFLNSFYSSKFEKNKNIQMKNLREYVKNWDNKKNLVLITHYVVILEALNYTPSSGEIVVSDKNFNLIGTYKTKF
tara:strand:- start:1303 stop:1860 length:558 start_codon:yes stop_codon:yes gene_type:complete